MIRRVFMILTTVFMLAFAVNRLDASKSISSEYMLLSTVEKQNYNQILRAVKYNIPSFNQEGYYINTRPKDGVFILDTATDDLENLKNDELHFNNNYMFPMRIDYANATKKVEISSFSNLDDMVQLESFNITTPEGIQSVNVLYTTY